jgi:hypothetical protein
VGFDAEEDDQARVLFRDVIGRPDVGRESGVVRHEVVGRDDRYRAPRVDVGDAQQAIHDRGRRALVLGLHHQRVGRRAREQRGVVEFVLAGEQQEAAARADQARDPAAGLFEHRLAAPEPAELLGSVVAGDQPCQGTQPQSPASGEDHRPSPTRHDVHLAARRPRCNSDALPGGGRNREPRRRAVAPVGAVEAVGDGGRPVEPPPPLSAIRERCARELAALPAEVRRLRDPAPYPVHYSDACSSTSGRWRSR